MDVSTRTFDNVVVVAPQGRADLAGSSALEAALSPLWGQAGVGGIVLDFSAVPYISSVGLRVLMIAAKEMRNRRLRIAVAGLQPIAAEIFAIPDVDGALVGGASLTASDFMPIVAAAAAAVEGTAGIA